MMNDKIKDVYERRFNFKITKQDKTWVPHSTCYNIFWDGKKARTGNILYMTNLKCRNNREAELTVIFATQMIVVASIEGPSPKFSTLKFRP